MNGTIYYPDTISYGIRRYPPAIDCNQISYGIRRYPPAIVTM
jgi:hypothetical protein